MSTAWITKQILAIRRANTPPQFNPRPAGLMLPGSTTEAVYLWLVERGGDSRAWWTCQQIITGTGRTRKACDWALIYLRRGGLIEHARDFSPQLPSPSQNLLPAPSSPDPEVLAALAAVSTRLRIGRYA